MVAAPFRKIFINQYQPFLAEMGVNCDLHERRYLFSVYTDSYEIKDYILEACWVESRPVDSWSSIAHIYSIRVFGESETEIEGENALELLEEAKPYLNLLLRNLFIHAVSFLAPEKWFVMPNQPHVLFTRNDSYPLFVIPMEGNSPTLKLEGKVVGRFKPTLTVTTSNVKEIVKLLTENEDPVKSIVAAAVIPQI